MDLKQLLIQKDLVIDNEYLEKYITLILNNLTTKISKGKTQKHHIIPKYYFRSKNIEVQEVNNLVNLLYKDHILAHYYLSLCSKNNYYMFSNLSALNYLLGKNKELKNSPEFLNQLSELQILYENYNQNRKRFINLKGVNNTKVWMNKNGKNIRVLPKDVESFKLSGFMIGCVRQNKTKKVWVNNNLTQKMIYQDELPRFLQSNPEYKIGRKTPDKPIKFPSRKGTPSPTLNKIGINNGKINKFISKSDLNDYINEGWYKGIIVNRHGFKHSLSAIQKIKNDQQNRIWIHQGNKNKKIKKEDLDKYIDNGYILGRYDIDKTKYINKNKRVWITKDGLNKSIDINYLDVYINTGWVRGRNTQNIVTKRLTNGKPPKKGINKGGKYMIKDGVKKHVYGNDIETFKSLGWRFLKDE